MLRRLSVRNFKSWPALDVDFGRITVLYGENSSGKSGLAQFLLMLKQTREAAEGEQTLALNGPFVRLGAARDVIHGHDESRALGFDLRFAHGSAFRIDDPSGEGGRRIASSTILSVGAEAEVYDGAFRCRALTHSVGNAHFRLQRQGAADGAFDLAAETPGSDFAFIPKAGRPRRLPGPVSTYRFPDAARTRFRNSGFLADLEAAFEEALDSLYHLGPLRERPPRDHPWDGSRPAHVGENGERTIDAILAMDDAGETQNVKPRGRRRPVSQLVAHWLRELGLAEEFRVVETAPGSNRWQVRVRTPGSAAEVALSDVGLGVAHVLPVITLLHQVPEGATVILEQPELHLHPMAQSALADVIVHAACRRRVQVVFESYSERLLVRLQRRIAEGWVAARDVALYHCRTENGASAIEALELGKLGELRTWPTNFMGDTFTDSMKTAVVRMLPGRRAAG